MSNHIADISMPPRCEEVIRAGALVAVSHSGRKDSQAMTILQSRIVPRHHLSSSTRRSTRSNGPALSNTSRPPYPAACR